MLVATAQWFCRAIRPWPKDVLAENILQTSSRPPQTYRFRSYPMRNLEPTLQVSREIATARSTSISSLALNYNKSRGVVPTVGIRNPKQAKENLQAFGWRLTDGEIQKIDSVSLEGKATKL